MIKVRPGKLTFPHVRTTRLAELVGPPELAEARIWYTKAAEAGHIDACVRLGLLLATRLDRPELAEARIWYTKAAEAGHTNAQHGLGVLLANAGSAGAGRGPHLALLGQRKLVKSARSPTSGCFSPPPGSTGAGRGPHLVD